MRNHYENGILKALRFRCSVMDTDDKMKLDAADVIEQLQRENEALRKHTSKPIFTKDYDGSSLCDLSRDIHEALDTRFNPEAHRIQTDDNYMVEGTITVTIEYDPDRE